MIRKRITHIFIAIFLVFSFPVSALADTPPEALATTTDTSSSPAAETTQPMTTENIPVATSPASTPATGTTGTDSTGPVSPTGAESTTYTYNDSTGLWENPYYTWDPTTHQTSPKTPQEYSYNPVTGMWDTTQYVYDAPSGKYIANVVSTPTNPTSALQASDISTTGPGSTNSTNTTSANDAYFNLFYDAKISNTLSQTAVSGAAAVIGNTVGGSALSGNAIDVMNIVNMLKSTFGLQQAADLMTFTTNINGDVVGDLYIDPNQISNQSVAVNNSNTSNNVAINTKGNGLINNDITLGANSGNATVDSNTSAGSATTGNADAVANIVNMINSAIAANKSFLGIININGNLDGDILLPPNFLDQLIASNAPHATVNISDNQTNNLTVSTTNNEAIANNVTLAAASGNAEVSNNTNAGNANTGTGNTNLTIFNLTGKQVIARDSILVFVNVLGKWVGLIMDAPAGTTAAAVGGNVTANNTLTNNTTVNSETNNVINNNLSINSQSGNAKVSNNTNAGNATTGNATASANIANIIDSQLSASDWFGLLFINVLGFWHGSFGIDTDAGTIYKQIEQQASASAAQTPNASAPSQIAVFHFIPKNTDSNVGGIFTADNGVSSQSDNKDSHPIVLASSTNGDSSMRTNSQLPSSTLRDQSQKTWMIPAASFVLVMLATSTLGSSGELADKVHARLLSYRLRRKLT